MSTPAFYDDLGETLAEGWRLLSRGADDRRSGFHSVQVATAADGAPDVRTVVLRGVEPEARRLRFHTDRRAAKVAQMRAEPRVMVLGYDAAAKIQLRLTGTAEVLTEGPAWQAAWDATAGYSRQCYRMVTPSAEVLEGPGAEVFDTLLTADGAHHFAVVRVTVSRLEWLYLSHQGHRRAVFEGEAGWRGRWLAP